jgi:hypothetical protein
MTIPLARIWWWFRALHGRRSHGVPATLWALLLGAWGVTADVVPGATPKHWPADPHRHTVSIARSPADKPSLKKIRTAETHPPGTNHWSSGIQNRIRLPRAVTQEALDYYQGLIEGYRKKSWTTYNEPRSALRYEASVTHRETFTQDGRTFREVDVVELKMTFEASFTEEGTQGLHFTKTRTVVLDRTGRVLAAFGDGPTEVPVFAI